MKKWICYFVLLTFILFLGCDKKDKNELTDDGEYLTIEDVLNNEDYFYMAVMANNLDTINLFTESGFDINKKNEDGWTALSVAMRTYGVEDSTVDYLLELGANPNIPDDGETPLELAILNRQNEKAISLLKHGALLQRSKGKKGTLIHEAIRGCNADVIEMMLECGGEKLLYTKGGTFPDYPVELAIDISGDIDINGKEVASMLLDKMDLSYTDEHGNNLLHRECIRGDLELIQMLLEKGMDVNAKNNQGLTPLRLARNYNPEDKKEKIVTLLLSCGAKEGKKKEKEDCEPQFTEQDFLDELKQKSDLNKRDENQRTSLHYAVNMEYLDAVKYLLSKNVDVNVQDTEGMIPLHFSVAAGNTEITKKLLDAKARLDVDDNLGLSPLNWAITQEETMAEKYELIRILIDKGAPINGPEKSYPPIFSAIGVQSNKALEMLIQNGAEVNIFNWANETPLERTIETDNLEGFELLLEKGADIKKKDEYGFSALDYLEVIPKPSLGV